MGGYKVGWIRTKAEVTRLECRQYEKLSEFGPRPRAILVVERIHTRLRSLGCLLMDFGSRAQRIL